MAFLCIEVFIKLFVQIQHLVEFKYHFTALDFFFLYLALELNPMLILDTELLKCFVFPFSVTTAK